MSDNGSAVAVNDSDDNNSEKLIADLYNALNVVSQPSLGESDKDFPVGMSVPDSDVVYITLVRSHQLKVINHALEGADYNTAIMREVIYSIGQSDFTQLYNNAKLVVELLGIEDAISFPKYRFPKSLAVLMFKLNDDLTINDVKRRNINSFKRIMMKKQKFDKKYKDLSGRIKKVSGIKWKTLGATKHYAYSFDEIVQWYSRCNLFEFNILEYKHQEVFDKRLHQSSKLLHKFENDLNYLIGDKLLRQLNLCGKQVINYLNTSYANYVGTCIKEMIGDKLRNRLAFL